VPRFMDFHHDLKLPAEAIAQIAGDTRDKRADQFGVRQVELYHGADGAVCCLLEGPDEDAIRAHHAALGVPCGDVPQVESLTWPGAARCARLLPHGTGARRHHTPPWKRSPPAPGPGCPDRAATPATNHPAAAAAPERSQLSCATTRWSPPW
jgi:Protein of unknown function (DUF4242)